MKSALAVLEEEYVRDLITLYGVTEAGRQVLMDQMFVYDVCWTEEGVFLPREEAGEEVFSLLPVRVDHAANRKNYRAIEMERGEFTPMSEYLCRLLNECGVEEAARRNLVRVSKVYDIPLPEGDGGGDLVSPCNLKNLP